MQLLLFRVTSKNEIGSNILKWVFVYYKAIQGFSLSGGSQLKTNRSTAIGEQASPQVSAVSSSQTKHPFLFLQVLSCSCIYSTTHKDSSISPAEVFCTASKEKADGTPSTKTHIAH